MLVCLCVRMLCIFVSVWRAWWEEHWGRGFVAGDFPRVTHTGLKSNQLTVIQSRHLQPHQKPAVINHICIRQIYDQKQLCQNLILCSSWSTLTCEECVCVSDAAIKNILSVYKNLQTLIKRPSCTFTYSSTGLYTPVKRQTLQMEGTLHKWFWGKNKIMETN